MLLSFYYTWAQLNVLPCNPLYQGKSNYLNPMLIRGMNHLKYINYFIYIKKKEVRVWIFEPQATSHPSMLSDLAVCLNEVLSFVQHSLSELDGAAVSLPLCPPPPTIQAAWPAPPAPRQWWSKACWGGGGGFRMRGFVGTIPSSPGCLACLGAKRVAAVPQIDEDRSVVRV